MRLAFSLLFLLFFINLYQAFGELPIYPIFTESNGQKIQVTREDILDPLRKVIDTHWDKSSKTHINQSRRERINKLAEKVGLFTEPLINPHLGFLPGDIAYWAEQSKASINRIELEFVARKAVLRVADRKKIVIDTQGDLSFAAQKLISVILKERQSLIEDSKNK